MTTGSRDLKEASMLSERKTSLRRKTRETDVWLELSLSEGEISCDTKVPFFDHMLELFAFHAGVSLLISCDGDIDVDDHHTVEDCGIALGEAFSKALSGGGRITRFGTAYAPMDEALARAVVDVSGRPFARLNLGIKNEKIGTMTSQNIGHAIESFAMSSKICVHIDVIEGTNDHHRAEAAFKAFALALRAAVSEYRKTGFANESGKAVNGSSTKGSVVITEETRE